MHRKLLSTVLAGLCGLAWIPSDAEAAWRVDPDQGSDANDGSAWTEDGEGVGPMLSIQAAVDAAFAGGGGEVWLKKGTHRPTTTRDTPQVLQSAIVMESGVSLRGGFDGTENDATERTGYVPYDTIIDVSTAQEGGIPAFHAVLVYQKTSVEIEGLTLTGGLTSTVNGVNAAGGGLFINGGTSTVAVRNCWIVGNRIPGGNGYGPAMYGSGISAVFEDVLFAGNDAGERIGGAIFVSGSSPTMLPVFRRCVFSGNSGGSGGAVYQEGGTNPKRFVDCVFSGNRSNGQGGAIFTNSGTVELVNCIVAGNRANIGGGILHYAIGSLRIANCTFASNSGEGIRLATAGTPATAHELTLRNVLFSGNAPRAVVEAREDSDVTEMSNCLFHGSTVADFLSENATNLTGAAAIDALADGTFANNVDGDPAFVAGASGIFESVVVDGFFVRLTDNDPQPAPFVAGALKGSLVRPDEGQPYILYIVDNTEDTITTIAATPIASSFAATPSYEVLDYRLQAGSAARDAGADFTAGAGEIVADLAGYPRPAGAGFDIGAYEFPESVASTVAIVSDAPDPSLAGAVVTIQAQVTVPSGDPTGTVEFFADASSLGTAPVADGTAELQTTTLPTGSVSLKAEYSGDGTYAGSTSAEEPHEVWAGADLMELR